MSKRSLRNALKARRASLLQAKATLVDALEAEQAASNAEATSTRLIQQEICLASDAKADDLVVEMLAAWLPQARAIQGIAAERHRMAAAATARARAEVAAARAAETAVEDIIKLGQDAESALAERQTQTALNEQILNQQASRTH